MRKPCEYCGIDLPLGVDKRTRRVRSFHFASCEKRPQTTPHSLDIEAQRDALLETLKSTRAFIHSVAPHGSLLERVNAAIKAVEEGK